MLENNRVMIFQVAPLPIGCQDPSNPIEVGRLLEMILSNRKLMFNASILSHLLAGLELVIPEMECQKTFRTAAMEFRSNFTEENVLDSIETLQNINNGADEWQVLSMFVNIGNILYSLKTVKICDFIPINIIHLLIVVISDSFTFFLASTDIT